MKQVDKISVKDLQEMAKTMYDNLVKADVDVSRRILVVDMQLHADGEAFLLEQGSKQQDLWGINLYPARFGTDDFIEFDSMINLKPKQGNTSRNVIDETTRATIKAIVMKIVHE